MEEHFKNKLKNHKVDWDKEALLGNLQKELHPKKNSFNKKWFLLLPLLLLATCWGWNNFQMTAGNTALIQLDNNSGLNKNKNAVLSLPKYENNLEETQHHSNSINSLNKKELNNEKELIQPNLKIKRATNTDLENNNNNNNNNNKSNQALNLSNALEANIFNFSNSSKTNSPTSKGQWTNDEFQNSNTAKANTTGLPNTILKNQTTKNTANNIAINIDKNQEDILRLNTLSPSEWKELNWIGEQVNLPDLIIPEALLKKDIKKVRLNNPFYISASGEVGLVYRNRKFNSNNPEFVSRLEDNDETEKSLFTISTNLYIGYQHPSGWSVQSGLEYNEINEVFNYKETIEETLLTSEDEILYPIIDNMDTSYALTTKKIILKEERIVKHFNKHTFYSVPLLVGYRFDLKKARLTTRLGLSYTFSNSFKGRMNHLFESGGNEITGDSPELLEIDFGLKNKIGMQAGIALEYPFLKWSQVFASATYRRSPGLTLGLIEQRYHSVSVGVGVRVGLGGRE